MACVNADVCGRTTSPSLIDARTGRCLPCNLSHGRTLVFLAPVPDAECAICLVPQLPRVKMPSCRHTLCTACASVVLRARLARCPLCRAAATLEGGVEPGSRYKLN